MSTAAKSLQTDPLATAALRWPDAIAYRDKDGDVTFEEASRSVDRTIKVLDEADVGSSFAVVWLNGLPLIRVFWAAWRSGRMLVPLNTRWPAHRAEAAAERIGVSMLPALPPEGAFPPGRLPAGENVHESETDRAGFLWGSAESTGDRAVITIHTSGSTGTPKAAVLSHRALIAGAEGAIERLHLLQGDCWRLTLPLFHVGGVAILVRAALAGASVEMSSITSGFPARVTHISLVATQLKRLLDMGVEPGSLKCVLLGGSAIPKELANRATAGGWPIVISYGLTEMGSLVTAEGPGRGALEPGSSGSAFTGRAVTIAEDGEIRVRGAALFSGYIGDSGALTLPLDQDGWFRTGDLGELGAAGQLFVCGRKDNQFVSGGENIQPEAIERALLTSEDLLEAVVVPVSDDEFGERPFAFIEPAESPSDPGALFRELERGLRAELPGYMVPVGWALLSDHRPLLGIKVDRSALCHVAQRLMG